MAASKSKATPIRVDVPIATTGNEQAIAYRAAFDRLHGGEADVVLGWGGMADVPLVFVPAFDGLTLEQAQNARENGNMEGISGNADLSPFHKRTRVIPVTGSKATSEYGLAYFPVEAKHLPKASRPVEPLTIG